MAIVRPHLTTNSSPLTTAKLVDPPLRLAIGLLLGGFALFDRAFAYIHIPGTPFYIGELALILCLLYVVAIGRYRVLAVYSVTAFFLGIFLVWSAFRAAPYLNNYALDAVRDSAVWYYFVLGLVVYRLVANGGPPAFTGLYRRLVVISLLWYPIALVLSQFGGRSLAIPDSDVSVFSHKMGNLSVHVAMAIAWVWLLSSTDTLQKRPRRLLLTSLGMVTLFFAGIINRGGMVAATTALLLAWAFSGRHLRRAALTVPAVFVASIGMFWLLDLRIELPFSQREISASQFMANMQSIIGNEPPDDLSNLESTVSWRLDLWARTVDDINKNAPLSGRGYGMNLGVFYGVQGNFDSPLRSPHNSHLTVFARSGWFGLVAWVALWAAWFAAISETRRRYLARGDQTHGNLALWCAVSVVAILVNAIFDPTLESPQVSAWLWAVFGLGLGLWHHARWPTHRPLPASDLTSDQAGLATQTQSVHVLAIPSASGRQ